MRRSRRSYAYLISARLGDAMAAHIVMVWAATYVTGEGGGREIAKARLVHAEQHTGHLGDRLDELYHEIDEERGGKWDHLERKRPEMYGLGCVVDQSRNSAFQTTLRSRRLNPDLAQIINNDRLDDWSPHRIDTLVGRPWLVNDLANELRENRVELAPDGNIPIQDIKEALEGFKRKSTEANLDLTVVVETDYRDDIALCLSLGVFWSHYRPPASANWLVFEQEGGNVMVPYSGAVV